jgi:hypothetical protein
MGKREVYICWCMVLEYGKMFKKISLDMGLGIEGSHQMDCENVAITAFSMRPEEIF